MRVKRLGALILVLVRPVVLLVLLVLTPIAYVGVPWVAQYNEPSVWEIAEVDGEAWIRITGGKTWGDVEEGVYRLRDDAPVLVLEHDFVTAIEEVNVEGWIGTGEGGFRGLSAEPIPLLAGKWVLRIESLAGDGWVGTKEGAYRVRDGEIMPILESHVVLDFEEIGGEVWIATNQGAYRMKGGEPVPAPGGIGVHTLAEVAGDAWVGTFSEERADQGDVLWMKDGELVTVMERQLIDAVLSVDDEAWIKTRAGYRLHPA